MKTKKIIFVLSSHWDREWHQTFQNFRYSLVHLLDEIIDGFDKGILKGSFQADGQAVMIEDYLQIRPEKTETIETLARENKLSIGPWYVMPDEFLVSGESLIRNLEIGKNVCRSLSAKPSAAGFVCDMFGHCSQLPQIFSKAGVRCGFLWRGININSNRNAVWQGADGTELPCYIFGYYGYGDFAFKVRRCNEYENTPNAEDIRNDIEKYFKYEVDVSQSDTVLVFDGCDHQHWDKGIYEIVSEYFEKGWNGYQVVAGSLDDYIDGIYDKKMDFSTKLSGELREPGILPDEKSRWLLAGVLSSRMHLKQRNAECQNILTSVAEPLSVLSGYLLNKEYPYGFIELAWKYLLKNQAHDSICGCSIDRVHRDMIYRFDQCLDIAERIADESLMSIAASIKTDDEKEQISVLLYNSLASDSCREVELTIDIPAWWASFRDLGWAQKYPDFNIIDASTGEKLPHQFIKISDKKAVRLYRHKVPEKYQAHKVTVVVSVKMPSLGYKLLKVLPSPTPTFYRGPACLSLVKEYNVMENEHIRVEIQPNGTLDVFDKKNGQIYKNILIFEDTADIGDNWDYCKPVNDAVCVSTAASAEIELLCDGPLTASFKVRTHLKVPKRFCFDTMQRSDEYVDLSIENIITLNASSEYIDIQTELDNKAADHRLRVLFESGCNAENYLCDSVFDVAQRQIKLRHNGSIREMETETKPQQSWTAVYDDSKGLAVISDGLPEVAVRDTQKKPIALTLIRATRRIVFDGCGIDSQMQGKQRFKYRLLPLNKKVDYRLMSELANHLGNSTRYIQADNKKLSPYRLGLSLPAQESMLSIEGGCVLSSFRMVSDKWQMRIFNPESTPSKAVIVFNEKLINNKTINLVDFTGNSLNVIEVPKDNRVSIELKPKEIATMEGA